MKIGLRLGIAFGLVLFFLVLTIFIGINNLSGLNTRTEELVNQDFEKVQLCTDALDNLRGSIARIFQLVAVEDVEQANTARQRFKKNSDAFNEDISKLDKLLQLAEARELLVKLTASRDRYDKATAKVIALLDGGNRPDAAKQAYGEAYKELHAFAGDVRNLVDLQKKVFKATGDESIQTYHSARLKMLILGLIAILVGIASGVIITRSITLPLEPANFFMSSSWVSRSSQHRPSGWLWL